MGLWGLGGLARVRVAEGNSHQGEQVSYQVGLEPEIKRSITKLGVLQGTILFLTINKGARCATSIGYSLAIIIYTVH